MGMDVCGNKPISQKGEYFRNNVWWWHPLWDYCCYIDQSLIKRVPGAHENSGDGLGLVASRTLGLKLQHAIDSGEAQKYVDSYYESVNSSSDQPCFCLKESLFEVFSITGHIPFPKSLGNKNPDPECHTCKGSGLRPNWLKSYHINVENIQNFAEFLIDCGGFQIC